MRRLRHLLVAALALIVLVAALAAGYGGAAPAASKTPIRIGYVNDESGSFAVPFVTIGTKVAEKYTSATCSRSSARTRGSRRSTWRGD